MAILELITDLVSKVVPTNWYTTKKTCDLITTICTTIVELKWFVFPTLVIVFLSMVFLAYTVIKHSDKVGSLISRIIRGEQ